MLSPRQELEVIKAATCRERNQVTKREAREALGCLPQVRMRRGIESGGVKTSLEKQAPTNRWWSS
jgi:hypothetical protein